MVPSTALLLINQHSGRHSKWPASFSKSMEVYVGIYVYEKAWKKTAQTHFDINLIKTQIEIQDWKEHPSGSTVCNGRNVLLRKRDNIWKTILYTFQQILQASLWIEIFYAVSNIYERKSSANICNSVCIWISIILSWWSGFRWDIAVENDNRFFSAWKKKFLKKRQWQNLKTR